MTDDRPRVPRPPPTGSQRTSRRDTPIVDTPPDPREPPARRASPAETSDIHEMFEFMGGRFKEDALAVLQQFITDREAASETRMGEKVKEKTRPLKYSLVGVIVTFLGSCGWLWNYASGWQDERDTAQRKQWELDLQQQALDTQVVEHLETDHVSPEDIKAVNTRLDAIEKKLGEVGSKVDGLTEQGKAKKRPGG